MYALRGNGGTAFAENLAGKLDESTVALATETPTAFLFKALFAHFLQLWRLPKKPNEYWIAYWLIPASLARIRRVDRPPLSRKISAAMLRSIRHRSCHTLMTFRDEILGIIKTD